MKRLLICLDKRELFDAKTKKCLTSLCELIISLTLEGHVVVILPLINVRAMKHTLEQEFLFESELSTIIIKNSMLFFDGYGKLSNPLHYIPRAMQELSIHPQQVIVVDTWAQRLEEAANSGYATLRVPNLENPIYTKYIAKLDALAKILCMC